MTLQVVLERLWFRWLGDPSAGRGRTRSFASPAFAGFAVVVQQVLLHEGTEYQRNLCIGEVLEHRLGPERPLAGTRCSSPVTLRTRATASCLSMHP
jgi:hypothetical protein